ncbi:MoaD/ThiS family protein [Candidatus Bathyarchaeota archaeon]|nr:MoaD/ThiS family protein [Candidatus Bathyarchaeota archaeon]MBS7617092.1 MoaD/ThiS family protein [Candidatus Bathyarchaeota archaeon]
MVKIKVRFYASLRDEIGVGEFSVYLNDGSFNSLMNNLRALLGDRVNRLFSEGGMLRNGLIVSVNNTIVYLSKIQELKLRENDVVDFMPAPSGG